MGLITNASIEAPPAGALETGAGLPKTAAGEQTLSMVPLLARMVSGIDSYLDGCDHVYEASCGVWPQLDEAGE
ncbi:MAG: hypothetical protein M3460_24770 [Actinomycetota bacterium]|nr:hypothetical protein [Actinomycetota bacterium]